MCQSPHLRWIEESEARRAREFAVLQQAASEPHASIILSAPGPTWRSWLHASIPRVAVAVFSQGPSPD